MIFFCKFHYINVILEAVAGIVGRADVGSAMFFLCSLLCYKKSTDRLKSDPESSTNMFGIFLCLLFALGAMYTKEQGVTVLGVCVVYEILMVSKCNIAFPNLALKAVSTLHTLLSCSTLVFCNLRASGYLIRFFFR